MSGSEDPSDTMPSAKRKKKILYCLDFDGVLCDSVNETFHSGLRACRLIWNESSDPSKPSQWIDDLDRDSQRMKTLMEDFRYVRPILYVGWESILLIRFLACGDEEETLLGPNASKDAGAAPKRLSKRDAVFQRFHSGLKDHALEAWGFSAQEYGAALSDARNAWISQGDDDDSGEGSWIDAHGFYGGACEAVRYYLREKGNEDIYVITTKAKEFALRLLEKQDLFRSGTTAPAAVSTSLCFKDSHVFGLGSGPKASVLQRILEERQSNYNGSEPIDFVAVMVEDNVATLDKISRSPVGNKILSVVASWGYNSNEQLAEVFQAKTNRRGSDDKDESNCYIVLPPRKNPESPDTMERALEWAQCSKDRDPSGSSLASVLLTPGDAGRLLAKSCPIGTPIGSEDEDQDPYDFSSAENIAEAHFR